MSAAISTGYANRPKLGEMPLAIYKPLHPEAKLTAEDLEALKGWAAAYGAHDDD